MQKYTEAYRSRLRRKFLSFFLIKITIVSFLALIGGPTLLLSGQAYAQLTHINDSSTMYTVVYDVTHHRYFTYGTEGQFTVASSIKVPILLTFLNMLEQQGRNATDDEQDLMMTMIENSNNDSASALYNEVGGGDGVTAYLQQIGVSGLSINSDAWGWSQISPSTMVSLLTLLNAGTILTPQDRTLVLNLMENVEADQQIGVGDTAPSGATVALKDGWVTGPDDLWAVNSSGIVTTQGETYIIAAYTQGQPSLEAGQNAIRQICTTVTTSISTSLDDDFGRIM
jgi:beta-lactamase class A